MDFNEIKTKIKGEVETDQATLIKYSRDASIFEIVPKCVVHPKDTEDLKSLVKWVAENKSRDPNLSITARSAGTDMGGGAINDSIIADFTAHFNKIEMFGSDSAKASSDKKATEGSPLHFYPKWYKIEAKKNTFRLIGIMFSSRRVGIPYNQRKPLT